MRKIWRFVRPRRVWLFATGAVAAIAMAGGLGWGAWNHVCDDCPSIAQIYAFEPKEATRVFAGDGSLLTQFAIEQRTAVPYSAFPAHLPQAFIAIEDRRFWNHSGIDVRRTVRAGLDFMLSGYDAAGGSTISQQLAGNMFSGAVDRQVISIRRKLKEMRVAMALERAYTKREILEAYINQINFGDGHYGVQSAADRFFGKDARDLNLPEAALLAALPKAPERYSPFQDPEAALQRRNLVLELMADQEMISRERAEAAKAYPISIDEPSREESTAPYFVEWVRRSMIERYGMDLYEAGLRVRTSLDPELQQVADSVLSEHLRWVEEQAGFEAPRYEETRQWPDDRLTGNEMPYIQGMFMAMDPRTGEILALVGGRDFEDSEWNRATQARRQPGSVFKPFVYTAALASGIPASEVIWDTPVEILMPDSTLYSPKNFGDRFSGPMTLREALYRSVNVVAVKLGQRVGVEAIAQYARRMGIQTPVPRVPSLAIGSASVIPLQVAEAYTTFANQGVRTSARPIMRVESVEGGTLWESQPEREEVLDEQTAWIMLSLLEDVVNRGTGIAVRQAGVGRDIRVAGKTGTTNDATDAWFVAFTPEIVTVTWVGFDRPRRLHINAQGSRDAAPVNAQILAWYYRDRPAPEGWERPEGLVESEVDGTTGMLATPWCPTEEVYTEIFIPGTQPDVPCDRHGPWSGEAADSLADSLSAPMDEDFDW